MRIDDEIKIEEDKIKTLREAKAILEGKNSFSFTTNTAYLSNQGIIGSFGIVGGRLGEWVNIKHGQHWKGMNDSIVEVTFKIVNPKLSQAVEDE